MKKPLLYVALSGLLASANLFEVKAQCPIIPFAVVELFTSQGCSSCPNGDLLLSNLINQEANTGRNVICIAEHVTYWDHLNYNGGPWADQYGMAMFNSRQDAYVTTSAINVKGTPQLFVNGKKNVTSTSTLNSNVNLQLGSGNAATVGVCLSTTSSNTAPTIAVNYNVSGNYAGNNLIVCLVENDRTVTPTTGENAGVPLHHDGVARVFTIVPLTSATGTVNITPPANCVRAKSRIVAYVQAPITSSSNATIKGATKGLDLSNTALGLTSKDLEEGLSIYPNPAMNDLHINYANANVQSNVEFTMTDLSGRIIFTETITNNGNGEYVKNLDVSTFAKGIYIVNVKADNEVVNKKIVIQ